MNRKDKIEILKKENKELKSLIRKIKRDLNYLRNQKYETTTPLAVIGSRIEMINKVLVIDKRGKTNE